MHYISLLFYPHILLLMIYVGGQRLWNFFAVFLGPLLGMNVLTFLISKLIIAPSVLPTVYARWPEQTLAYVFLGFYIMAILGNLMMMYFVWKGRNTDISPWGWFMRSFGVALCVYGPYALISCEMRGGGSFMCQAFLSLPVFVCLGLIFLSRFILSWVGVSKASFRAGLFGAVRWALMLGCSMSIGINLWNAIRYRPAVAFWHNPDTTFKEVMFEGDTWTFRKTRSQKGDLVNESLRLDNFFGEGMEIWQKSSAKEATTTTSSHTVDFKIS